MTADFPGLLAFISSRVPASAKQVYSRARPFLPGFAKTLLQPFDPWAARDALQSYWRNGMKPQDYLPGEDQSSFLTGLIEKYHDTDARILEIGCNVGRNLNHLFSCGFRNLEGIEISQKAVHLMKEVYPEMTRAARIYHGPVEDVIRMIPDNRYDCVFTLGVLEHIHWDSEWIFPEVVRIAKNFLITIEEEARVTNVNFPRNYRDVFERLGARQAEEVDCKAVEGLGECTARILMVA